MVNAFISALELGLDLQDVGMSLFFKTVFELLLVKLAVRVHENLVMNVSVLCLGTAFSGRRDTLACGPV